jgi:t-SNARE complex subunit (syntaxin)
MEDIEKDQDLQNFFITINEIKENISRIDKNSDMISRLNNDLLVECNKQKKEKLNSEIIRITNGTNVVANIIRASLKKISTDNKNLTAQNTRIKKDQFNLLSQIFVKSTSNFSDVLEKNKERHRKQVIRQCLTVNPTLSEREINNVLNSNQENIQEIIFSGGKLEAAEKDLSDINERHISILELERSLMELNEIFLDISTIIEFQGTTIESISQNVERAESRVERADVNLGRAVEYKKSYMMKRICIWTWCIIAFAGFITFVYFFLIK